MFPSHVYVPEERLFDIRYYMGKVKCKVILQGGKKHYIEWLESGMTGNNQQGYKEVFAGGKDICPSRMLYRKRKAKSLGLCQICDKDMFLHEWTCETQNSAGVHRHIHLKCYFEEIGERVPGEPI